MHISNYDLAFAKADLYDVFNKLYDGFLSELSDMLTCTESSTTAFYFKEFDNVWFEISEDLISISFIDEDEKQIFLNYPIEESFFKVLKFKKI